MCDYCSRHVWRNTLVSSELFRTCRAVISWGRTDRRLVQLQEMSRTDRRLVQLQEHSRSDRRLVQLQSNPRFVEKLS